VRLPDSAPHVTVSLTLDAEIGHEKAQSVIDSITSSYAAEGQAANNPMLQNPMAGPGGFPPPPFGFPGRPGAPGMPAGAPGLPPPPFIPPGRMSFGLLVSVSFH
jgi:hypothetical protein